MTQSLCREHAIEYVTWDDPPLLSHTSDLSTTTTTTSTYNLSHFRSFMSFVEGSMRYQGMGMGVGVGEGMRMKMRMRGKCQRLVVIDLLPTSLLRDRQDGRVNPRIRDEMYI